MDININNYEVFIIDYLDGKLGTLETAQLLVFLENHPGLKEEFEDLKTIIVTPNENEVFGFNESLKQPSDADAVNLSMLNYPHYFIAAVEGDLTATGQHLVGNFLKEHPELASDYELFKATKLIPNKKIRYPETAALKMTGKSAFAGKHVFMKYYFATGIAATLLLLFTIWLRLSPGTESDLDNNLRNSIEQQGANRNTELEIQNSEEIQDSKFETQNSKTGTENNTEFETRNPESGTRNPEPGTLTPKEGTKSTERGTLNTSPGTRNKEKGIRNPVPGTRNLKSGGIKKIEKKGMIINTTPLYSENRTRNFYSGLYDDIKLSQELTMAEKEERDRARAVKPVTSAEKKGAVTAGRLINSMLSSGEQLAEQLPESLNGWLFADLGVKGFNLLTNNSYVIDRKIDKKGKIEFLKLTKEEENL